MTPTAESTAANTTFRALIERYGDSAAGRVDAALLRHSIPDDLLDRSLDEITAERVTALIDQVFNRGDVDLGHRLMPALDRCFGFGRRTGCLEAKPFHIDPLRSLLRRGLRALLAHHDRLVDRRLGIATSDLAFLPRLTVTGGNGAAGQMYRPSPVLSFRRAIGQLRAEPRDHVFVDFGSGKGRTLILAAELGFRRVIGVEFARELHAAALDNVAHYQRARPDAPPIDSVLCDAADFPIPEAPCVFYFYNPFGRTVLAQVLSKVRESFQRNPRKLFFVYCRPQHRTVFEGSDFVAPLARPRRRLDALVPALWDIRHYETTQLPVTARPAAAPRSCVV